MYLYIGIYAGQSTPVDLYSAVHSVTPFNLYLYTLSTVKPPLLLIKQVNIDGNEKLMTDSFLVDDDHETWCLLSSGALDDSNSDVSKSLTGVEQRFVQDHTSADASDYWKLLISTAQSLGFAIQQSTATTNQNPTAASSATLPVAFGTTSGTKHVDSLGTLLNVDSVTVVQLTFGALSDVNTDQHLQSLLGTRSLFLKVLNYYCQQRSARIGIITELLRANSNDSLLDQLDRKLMIGQNQRGLWQNLICCACAPECPPTRDQILPLKEMGDEFFVQQVLQIQFEQRLLEREQALEALLALLYARLSATSVDFCIMLLALQSCGQFFTQFGNPRLAQLAGLLCAEAVNLNNAGPSHIMVSPDINVKLLNNVVTNFSDQIDHRRTKQHSIPPTVVPAPESIAMLALGLLLKNIPGETDAMECLQLANDCGAFEYLQFCFDALLPAQTSIVVQGPYHDRSGNDWQVETPQLSIEDEPRLDDMSANLVIYTSIGLELLNSVVASLGEFMASPDNLMVLCNLGATLFANQPILCQEFWRHPGSIGTLVETSFDKTVTSWKILASLCCDRESVNRVIDMMPPDYVWESIGTAGTDIVTVLSAIAKMARHEPNAIRRALHDDPGVLFRILAVHSSNDTVLEQILDLLASLLHCSSWAMTAVKFFGARSSHDLLCKCFASSKSTTNAARVLQSLVEVMSVTCFNCPEQGGLEYISVTVKASLAACLTLTNIFAFSRQPTISYSNAYVILSTTSALVASLRQLGLHASTKIRDAALEARANILEAFSTSTPFGEAISYFAAAPVSLSIGLVLEKTLHEASLLQVATDEYAVDDASNLMGKWHGVLQKAAESPILKLVLERIRDFEKLQIDMRSVYMRTWSDGEYAPIYASAAAISLLKTWAIEAEDFLLTQVVPKDFLTSASPFRLLTSSATMPPVVRSDAKLAHIWPSCGFSTYDMLVHLVANTEVSGFELPVYDSIALLSLTAAHAQSCGGLKNNVFSTTSPLFAAMKSAINEAADLIAGTSNSGDAVIQKGIMFVKLLGNILEVDAAKGILLLEHDSQVIGSALLDSVKAVARGASNDKDDRFALECLYVLRLAKRTNSIHPDLVVLATASTKSSIVRTILFTLSAEILAQSLETGDNFPELRALFNSPTFHEDLVLQFRDSVVTACKSMARFESVIAPHKTLIHFDNPSLVMQAFPISDTRVFAEIGRVNAYDIKSAATLIYSLNKEDSDPAQVVSATEAFLLSVVSVKKHVGAVAAWAKLVHKWISNDAHSNSTWCKQIEIFLVEQMDELGQLMRDIVNDENFLSMEILDVLDVSSELLLGLISFRPPDSNLEYIDLQKLVRTIETVSLGSVTSRVQPSLLNNLLAAAAVVVKGLSTAFDLSRFVPIVIQALAIRDDSKIFQTSMLLLASVIDSVEQSDNRKAREKFSNALSETGMVNLLVEKASLASAGAINDKQSFDDDQVMVVESLFVVLLAFSNSGGRNASIVPLFTRCNLSKMFLSNPLFAQAIPRWTATGIDSHYRGYIKSSSKKSNEGGMERVAIFLSGSSDPVHSVWRLAMRLLTSLLRVSAIHGQGRIFEQLALDFVLDYDGVLRSCLSRCSAIGIDSVLTRNLVDEADEFMALLSALSIKSDGFLDAAVALVGSLGKFLGSIGTSRFLFKLVRDVEAASQEQDNSFDNLQEFHSSLSGGVGNARFEAIRYAHYARSAYAMVTGDDNKQFSIECGTYQSGSELEATCYKAINNEFCSQLEVQVAYCLTNALSFISKTHPASRCFIRFSKEECRRLNPFNIVKNGAIIAAHAGTDITFARVVRADTVRRSWTCNMINPVDSEPTEKEVVISVDDLAGVEDVTKRIALFHFLAAPDSATHMESADYSNASNLGHLILILQWCRQGGNRIDVDIWSDLAEIASAVLATEWALHHEIGTDKLANESVVMNVNDQLFDLFDKGSKFPELSVCIEPDFLQRIQVQLKHPLELARMARAEKRQLYEQRLAAMNASNPWR